jgi:hypothetical protein
MLYFYLRALHIEPVYEGYERKERNNKRGKGEGKREKYLHRSEKVGKTRKKGIYNEKERRGEGATIRIRILTCIYSLSINVIHFKRSD